MGKRKCGAHKVLFKIPENYIKSAIDIRNYIKIFLIVCLKFTLLRKDAEYLNEIMSNCQCM